MPIVDDRKTVARAMSKTVRDGLWLLVRARNALRPQPTVRLPVPVISVGNITVGGTGKTPLTQWLVVRLHQHGHRPAILTPLPADADEVREHATTLPCPIYPGRDRVATAHQALVNGATAIVLDDGFQYRRLHRQLDIVLWDAMAWLHPDNPLLREPLAALQRADVVVLSKADALDAAQRRALQERLNAWANGAKVLAAFGYVPSGVWAWQQKASCPVTALSGLRVVAATAIGNPLYFALTAQRAGCEVVALVCFPDHHRFTPADAEDVLALVRRWKADGVLTTRKDGLKWQKVWQAGVPLWILEVHLHWFWGENALLQTALSACPGDEAVAR